MPSDNTQTIANNTIFQMFMKTKDRMRINSKKNRKIIILLLLYVYAFSMCCLLTFQWLFTLRIYIYKSSLRREENVCYRKDGKLCLWKIKVDICPKPKKKPILK